VSGAVTYVELRPGDHELLERLYEEILQPAFAAAELQPLDLFRRELTAEPRTQTVTAALSEADGSVLGCSVCDWDEASRVFLLSYLAVRPGLRAQGIGGGLMSEVANQWVQRNALVTLAEVDDPRVHAARDDHGDPVARLRFYERLGGRLLAMPYTQPEVHPGTGRIPGMLLLALYVSDEATLPGPRLRSAIIGRFLAGYYAESEGAHVLSDDIEVRALIDGLNNGPDGIALVPVSGYTEIPLPTP
jgi:GNAT superfamily N-acetyltransferase